LCGTILLLGVVVYLQLDQLVHHSKPILRQDFIEQASSEGMVKLRQQVTAKGKDRENLPGMFPQKAWYIDLLRNAAEACKPISLFFSSLFTSRAMPKSGADRRLQRWFQVALFG